MKSCVNLEKKINSELTTKIKKTEIRHDQLYINIESEDLLNVALFIKNNENTKFRQLIDITVVDHPENSQRFKVVYLFGEPWKTALPLHLCDFSALSIAGYLVTGNKHLFNFAFFWGIAGAGMAILTPNAVYAFPSVDYLANQYGHTLILLGISVAMIVFNERPYAKDIFIIFGFTTLILIPLYLINYLLEAPANYWYLLEKPYGDNIMTPLPEAPYHMLYLYPIAFLFFLALYAPYYFKDKMTTSLKPHISS